jgi:predicted transposase YdaD
VEHLFKTDTRFYNRYFAEIFLYLHQDEVIRLWYGLLILPSQNEDLGSDIPYESLLREQVKRLYLEDLLPLTDLSPNLSLLKLVVDEAETASLARSIVNSSDTEVEFQRRLDLVEAILVNKFPQLSTEEILKMLNLKTIDVTQSRFYQEVLQIGQQEGRQEGETDLVLRLLQRRCGLLSFELQAQVRALPLAQLEALGESLLDFSGMADLENWFKQRG